jgi:DNA-binding transcriptional regulator YiaG
MGMTAQLTAGQEPEIERWRKLTGLTVQEVAQLLDINLSTWHRWITGKSRPERKYRMRLDTWVERQQIVLAGGTPNK